VSDALAASAVGGLWGPMNVYGGAGITAGVYGSQTALGAAGMGGGVAQAPPLGAYGGYRGQADAYQGAHLSVVDSS
jgi:hypothetical protein